MPQFSVYRNPEPETRGVTPFLLDVQSELFEDAGRRVVVPLVLTSVLKMSIPRLNPQFVIDGKRVLMSTLEIVSVPRAALGAPVATLAERRDEIIPAIDYLLQGV